MNGSGVLRLDELNGRLAGLYNMGWKAKIYPSLEMVCWIQ